MNGAQVEHLTVDIDIRQRWRRSAVRVLDDITVDLPAETMTALVGESGCGKSMVASALCGLLPPGATALGTVTIGEAALTGDELDGSGRRWAALRGHRVGLVPQSAASSFTPVRTLGSQLDEVIATLDGPHDAARLCRRVHLDPSALDLFPHELSGGMAQRAAIAAAMAGDPEVIVADEPTSALDPDLAAGIWDLLAESAGNGAAVLVITHDIAALRRGCHSIAVMRAGRIVEHREPADILRSDDPYVAEFFLEAS
ncbi:ATP-binding cassette domain-containing protein [Gordonia jinghuaiqii]|uniref:Nickel import system ATP-binding protein NikD n=1 Tax=Gordonia jinghuaiqii TaxID=2758710 RepID=A0A7D7QPD1_9ACTN|nr:ATP-binding cassette domain-containing protein [Gordonia jinghuaiqii]MCR5978198.1 ATP-binding cassette domain-containing protein [Gordonia jinghuaiqii]QMT01346.1 ABC transporter ATP-binding protein [Gordonia jinghuaiqii]